MSDDAVKSKAVFFLLFPLLLLLFGVAAQAQPAFQVKDLNTTRADAASTRDGPALPRTISSSWEGPSSSAPPTGSTAPSSGGPTAPKPAPAWSRTSAPAPAPPFRKARGRRRAGSSSWPTTGCMARSCGRATAPPAGTVLVKDLIPANDRYTWINGLAELNGLLLFCGIADYPGSHTSSGGATGRRRAPSAWRTFDGRTTTSTSPVPLARLGGKLFFFGEDSDHGRELWTTDGTSAGTVLLKDISPGSSGGAPGGNRRWRWPAARCSSSPSGPEGFELWASDGTAAGTVLVKDIRPGSRAQSRAI